MFVPSDTKEKHKQPFIMSPFLLGAVSIVALFKILGFLPILNWLTLLEILPILALTFGLELILRSKSTTLQLVMGVIFILVLGGVIAMFIFLPESPILPPKTEAENLQVRNVWSLRQDAKTAEVSIVWPPGKGITTALNPTNSYMLFGNVMYADAIHFDINREIPETVAIELSASDPGNFSLSSLNIDWTNNYWQIWLHPALTYSLDYRTSSGEYTFYLDKLTLKNLFLKTGSGNLSIYLPEHPYTAQFEIGNGTMTVQLPQDTPVSIEVRNNSGEIFTEGLNQETRDDDLLVYTSPGYRPVNSIKITVLLDKGTLYLTR